MTTRATRKALPVRRPLMMIPLKMCSEPVVIAVKTWLRPVGTRMTTFSMSDSMSDERVERVSAMERPNTSTAFPVNAKSALRPRVGGAVGAAW